VDKFDNMMIVLHNSVDNFRQLIAADIELGLFNRVWCVAELSVADNNSMTQTLVVYNEECIKNQAATHEKLDMRNCHATRIQDKEDILKKIDDIDAFNDQVQRLIFDGLLPRLKRRETLGHVGFGLGGMLGLALAAIILFFIDQSRWLDDPYLRNVVRTRRA